jgi:metal-responsive CopG/Arc/MetJ family transcriptional regulator
MREPITISLESKVIERIDNSKGKNEPRSRFIEDIISGYFDKYGKERDKN